MSVSKEVADRFWSKVEVRGPKECWPWIASGNSDGRGRFWWKPPGETKKRCTQASRVAWFLTKGSLPHSELNVCHSCDNPSCTNPQHFFLGTDLDNMRDAAKKKRLSSPKVYTKRKLNISSVQEIRVRAAQGETLRSLAREFKVTYQNIRFVLRRETWKHVD